MRLPVKGSRGEVVLRLLYSSTPCTIEQAILRHAGFGLAPASILAIYERLVASGCADLQRGVYSISRQVKRHFDQLAQPEPLPGTVAGPAYRPTPKPLDVSRSRMVATREGALDYRDLPSRIGDQRFLFGRGR